MRERVVSALFVVSVLTIDFSPLAVYRYLLLSDLLLVAALVLQWTRSTAHTVHYPKVVSAAFTLYLASAAVAFLRPPEPGLGLFTWLHSAFLMGVYVPAATTLMTIRPDLRRHVAPALLTSACVQGLIVAQAVSGGLNWTSGTRIAGALGSIQLWLYAAAVVAALAMFMAGTRTQRMAAVISVLPLVAAEVFMRSRMLWIATFVGSFLFAVLQARRKWFAVTGAAAVLVMLAMGYVVGAYPQAVQVRISDALRPSQAADLRARMAVVYAALDAIDASPLVGVGTGQSPNYFSQLPVPPVVVNAHNLILHASMEGGFFAGVALFLLPLGILALWMQGLRRVDTFDRVRLHWAFATLTAVYVAAQLTPTLFEHSFFFLIAFLAATATGTRSVRIVSRPDLAPAPVGASATSPR